MKKVVLFIWQLPQNIIGLIILAYHKIRKAECIKTNTNNINWYKCKYIANAGISLGNFIFLDTDRYISNNDIKHEYGHSIQSKILGPFYLIIIGIPSFVGNIIDRIKPIDYYNQPWEKWADKLGKVNRKKRV